MSITERTLRKWRKEALEQKHIFIKYPDDEVNVSNKQYIGFQKRILQMTQELLDLYLLQKK